MTKNDVYEQVTDRIIAALEAGETVPWRKPWKALAGLPVNVRNGKPYRGVNVFLLGFAGYSDPRWGTYKAISEAGGQVRKGEKGTSIILWKPVKRKGEGEEQGSSYMLLKTYVVFNAEQADGLPELEREELREHEADERAEALVAGFKAAGGPGIFHEYDRAFYRPSADLVGMPKPEQFESSESYYTTLFHELVHSTGHEKRTGRVEEWTTFGSDPYAKEELVAEMGASMLAGLAGLEMAGGEQSAAYVANWLQRFKNDRKLVIQAAAAAQKAADMIAGTTFEELEAHPAPELAAA